MLSVTGMRPTIPEYWKDFINPKVNLLEEPKQCCPFHKEDTPSFSYSPSLKKCTCFGACHHTWDLVGLHMKNFNLSTRQEAEDSLDRIYKVPKKTRLSRVNVNLLVNNDNVRRQTAYENAVLLANNVDRWLELDYVMSKHPVDINELEILVENWKLSK